MELPVHGKTEVYLQLIKSVLDKGETAIMLVPEISLTPQMVNRFFARFGDCISVLHSKLMLGERYDQWQKIKERKGKNIDWCKVSNICTYGEFRNCNNR